MSIRSSITPAPRIRFPRSRHSEGTKDRNDKMASDHADKLHGSCTWNADAGYRAWSKYGEVRVFGDKGHRATELMLISAASCLGYLLTEYVRERSLPVTNIEVCCEGTLVNRPERLSNIITEVVVEGPISDAERRKMLTVCERACKVMNTLKYQPEIKAVLKTSSGQEIG